MTDREADLFRWFEVFTMGSVVADWRFDYALGKGLIEPVKGDGHKLTAKGEKWFTTRAAAILDACEAGRHEFAVKTTFGTDRHCRWCGECAAKPCGECTAQAERLTAPLPRLGGQTFTYATQPDGTTKLIRGEHEDHHGAGGQADRPANAAHD